MTGDEAVQGLVLSFRIRSKICLCSAVGERQRHSPESRRAYPTMLHDSHTKHQLLFHQPFEFSSVCLDLRFIHPSQCIDIGQVLYCVFMDSECVLGQKHAEKENK